MIRSLQKLLATWHRPSATNKARWQPRKTLGLVAGILIGFTVLTIASLLYGSLHRQLSPTRSSYATSLLLLMTIPALIVWLYHMIVLLSLRYELDRNRVCIACAFYRLTIPVAEIQEVVLGDEVPSGRFRGLHWPGYLNGTLWGAAVGTQSIATEPMERQIILRTRDLDVGISPRDPERFTRDLEQRKRLGSVHAVELGRTWRGLAAWPLWRDTFLRWLLAIGVILNLGLYGMILYRYDSLPARIALHYSAGGYADRIESKEWLFMLAGIGSITLLVNGLLASLVDGRERLAAHLLAGLSIGLQLVLWAATLGVLQ